MTREEEIRQAAHEIALRYKPNRGNDFYQRRDMLESMAQWADEHPSVETMLKLFWFFDKHGLVKEDLCFDSEHFMETVTKESLPTFDMEEYFKNRK